MPPTVLPPQGRTASTALYAISADPITFGHVDVIERVCRTFDRVLVGIGRNPTKKYLFSLDARLALARQALSHLPGVTVLSFHGMVVDFAMEQGAQVIVKGVRNAADFDYEQVHHLVGLSQRAGIDTHILFADPALAHVSSSAVKAIQLEHGFIHEFVPPVVKAALEEVLSGQLVIGVAGAGKSTLCHRLVEAGRREGLAVHDLDLDRIAHGVLAGADSALCARTRAALVERFGPGLEVADGIDRRRLAERAFCDPDAVRDLNHIMTPAVTVGLRKALYGLRGLVLVNGAVLVSATPRDLAARLAAREWPPGEVEARFAAQWTDGEKGRVIEQTIERSRFGRIWRWDGSAAFEDRATALLHQLLAETGAQLDRVPHAA
jgi:pantetheine-phosphate adenylyltransferase